MQDIKRNIILSIAAYAALKDIDPAILFQQSGINYHRFLQDDREEITFKQMDALCVQCVVIMDDELFGLHLGESMQLAALGIAGQIVLTSENIEEVLKNMLYLTKAVHLNVSLSLLYDEESISVKFTQEKQALRSTGLQKHMTDFLSALLLHELDGLTLKKIKPTAVIVDACTSTLAEYKKVLRTENVKQGDYCLLTFDKKLLKEKLISADHHLQAILLKNIKTTDTRLGGRSAIRQRIYYYIYHNAITGIPSLEETAADLYISSRHLQRLLKQEGSSFQKIVSEVNELLAIKYLRMGDYSIKEIASIMGYQEISGFTRAFTRWTGLSPSNYLKEQLIE